jgi:predicted Rossmann fold flavoprotein
MEIFDVAVIGAGPSGLMAAGRAAEMGARVVLVEKNPDPGRKLLLTGNGRCNLTQAGLELSDLVKKYGKEGKFLWPCLSRFGPEQVMEFFEGRGVALKVEGPGKVFPKSGRASDVLDAMLAYLKEGRVELRCNSAVKAIVAQVGKIKWVIAGDEKIEARNYILAAGGKSQARTGSSGDGYQWLRELGHKLTELRPGLVPLKVKDKWVSSLQGLSLKDVEVSVWHEKKKQFSATGDLVFTHFGLSGPAVLDSSAAVSAILLKGPAKLSIDLAPGFSPAELDQRLLRLFREGANKMLKNCLFELAPLRLVEFMVKSAAIDPDRKANLVSREDSQNLVRALKRLELTVIGTLGFDQAMITVGGVELKEVDPSSMHSKLVNNLWLAGEILNVSGPTGGFNLQACWSSGFLAGECAANC